MKFIPTLTIYSYFRLLDLGTVDDLQLIGSSMMWPELLDMTREESKRILRRVELEAYSSVVSAFRAQGDLTKEKKRLLHDLQNILRYV